LALLRCVDVTSTHVSQVFQILVSVNTSVSSAREEQM